jgi:hypothetical protein
MDGLAICVFVLCEELSLFGEKIRTEDGMATAFPSLASGILRRYNSYNSYSGTVQQRNGRTRSSGSQQRRSAEDYNVTMATMELLQQRNRAEFGRPCLRKQVFTQAIACTLALDQVLAMSHVAPGKPQKRR